MHFAALAGIIVLVIIVIILVKVKADKGTIGLLIALIGPTLVGGGTGVAVACTASH